MKMKKCGMKRTQGWICRNKPCTRPPHAKGLCQTCYVYMRDHNGAMRPLTLILKDATRVVTRKEKSCLNCDATNILAMGRCNTCYRFWKKFNYDRPRYLWDRDYRCDTCSYPLARDRKPMKGMCQACYAYKFVFKHDRPMYLWYPGPLGFCDCGNHAIIKWNVVLGSLKMRSGKQRRQKAEVLHLCRRCADVEKLDVEALIASQQEEVDAQRAKDQIKVDASYVATRERDRQVRERNREKRKEVTHDESQSTSESRDRTT